MIKINSNSGFSVLELVVALALGTTLMGMAIMNLKDLDNPLENSSALLSAFLKQTRARAISTTSAYTVAPTSSSRITASYANKCSDSTTTPDSNLILDLPNGADLLSTSWSVCFNARGLADSNLVVQIENDLSETESVEVFLGGAVQIQ